MQILVRNIDRSITEAALLDLFKKFGKVRTCDLVMDEKTGGSKGFGFVDMPDLGEAMKAVGDLNGTKLGSSVLRVKRASHSTVEKKNGR